MWWLPWNRSLGSYSAFTWRRRAQVSASKKRKLFSDRASVPELDRFLEQNIDRMQAELTDELAAAFGARGPRAERTGTLIRLALDFWTWRRLSGEGLDDEAAADLMAAAIATRGA